jgi:hypothetical protein
MLPRELLNDSRSSIPIDLLMVDLINLILKATEESVDKEVRTGTDVDGTSGGA